MVWFLIQQPNSCLQRACSESNRRRAKTCSSPAGATRLRDALVHLSFCAQRWTPDLLGADSLLCLHGIFLWLLFLLLSTSFSGSSQQSARGTAGALLSPVASPEGETCFSLTSPSVQIHFNHEGNQSWHGRARSAGVRTCCQLSPYTGSCCSQSEEKAGSSCCSLLSVYF